MRFTTQSIALLSLLSSSAAQVTPCISIGGWSFQVAVDYNVDDENGNDVQCTYTTLRDEFEEQIFSNDFLVGSDCANSVEDEFLAQLGVATVEEAEAKVYGICGGAQDKMKKM